MEPPADFKEVTEYIDNAIANRGDAFFIQISNMEKKCYDNAGDKVDNYVKCMTKLTKLISYQEDIFRYKTEHLKSKAYQCILDGQGSNSKNKINECKIDAKAKFDQFLKELNGALK